MSGRRWGLLAVLALAACTSTWWRAQLFPPRDLPKVDLDAPFLKCHMSDGGLYVLTRWSTSEERRTVSGAGLRYDPERRVVAEGSFELPFDSIALLETNRPERIDRGGPAALGLAVTGAVTAGVGAYCLSNPKACFGSCPTFYARGPGGERLVAEGFSRAVARVFEETDVDALDLGRPPGRDLEIVMRNEAQETHFVRSVRLLAVPRPPGGRVFHARGRYFPARWLAPISRCSSAWGDCAAAVREIDGVEYRSPADAGDLGAQETLEVAFPPPAGPAGLVITARNTLLNTFVLYQALAWLGNEAAPLLARVDAGRAGGRPGFDSLDAVLGRIRVSVLTRRGWVEAGVFEEVGPIARETQIVPLPDDLPPGEVRLRLGLGQGSWKIDRLALAGIGPAVDPVALEPVAVLRGGAPDGAALRRLRGEGDRLVSLPGDAWTLGFEIPPGLADPELFLESRGYYYEWMRREWLAEQDLGEAARFLADPRSALRRLAPGYKRIEADAERVFWSSRMGALP